MTHEEFKAMVNNRGKRQLIKALDKSKTPKEDKIGLFLGFNRLQNNDWKTLTLLNKMALKYGFTIKEENPRLRPVPLPYLGEPGVCALCGKDLPPRRRKWCSDDCAINYDRQRGFSYRWAAIEQNKKKHGHLACDKCSNPIEFECDATADHIKPLYLGGDHSVSNLQILCPVCNREKTSLDLKGVIQHTAKANAEAHTARNRSLDDFIGPQKP
jgi:5-methylcytosine-specific restriction endonuclease McrA